MKKTCILSVILILIPISPLGAEPPVRAIGVRPAKPGPVAGRRWLFMSGVNNYLKQPTLKYCRQDCIALRDELVRSGGFKPDNVVMLTDDAVRELDRPTYAQIYDRLPHMLESAGKDDLVLVYLSGHGAQFEDAKGKYACYVPLDGGSRQTSIPLSWVSEQMEACKARSKILILDCCRNDVAQGGKSSSALQSSLLSASQGKGFVTLFSCDAGQRSAEHDKAPNGVYTHYLIEGLAGKADKNGDKAIDVAEAHDYAHDHTQTWGIQHAQPQEPILRGEFATMPIITFVDPANAPTNQLPPPHDAGAQAPNAAGYPVQLSQSGTELSINLGIEKPLVCVLIPAGEFTMGTPAGMAGSRTDQYPAHRVRIEKPFFLGKLEITNAQFRVFRSDHVTKSPSPMLGADLNRNDQPAGCISWDDAKSFCEWLGGKTSHKVRLPSEAEWEYACRAGTTTLYPFGNSVERIGKYAWYWGNASNTAHVVGKLTPNDWGLFDMLGNVREWCEDTYHDSYTGAPSNGSSWIVEGEDRILRGGAWVSGLGEPNRIGMDLQSAFRNKSTPDLADASFGFRIVVETGDTSNPASTGIMPPLPPNARPSPTSPSGQSDATPPALILELAAGQKIEVVRIPAGEFTMGTPESEQNSLDNERPQHRVRIEKPFYMGKFEITQEQWKVVMGSEPFAFRHETGLPVEQVSWNDCQSFCEKASQLLKREFRLPTEAEWEYACRAGSAKQYGFGNAGDVQGGLGRYAWYAGNSEGKTHPVGSKKPNAWGLHDMHGNVWEWCEDVYHDTYSGAPSDATSWSGDHNARVLRGGSWYIDALGCRSTSRQFGDPAGQVNDVGFRIVLIDSNESIRSSTTRSKPD